jgi:hypothetical protein
VVAVSLFSVTSRGGLWGLHYLEDFRRSGFASRYANRFPIVVGGMSSIGELFPCSLTCPRAVVYSKNMISDMVSLGYKRIAERCLTDSARTVRVDEVDGSITLGVEASSSDIKFN